MEIDSRKLKKAFKILRRNYGAPGPDGVSIRDIKLNFPDKIVCLKQCLDNEEYSFTSPSYSTFVDFSGKLRTVYVYTVMDRWVQHYLKLELAPLINSLLQPYTFAYIRGRNNIQASEYVLTENPPYVLKLDVSDFFKSINTSRLYCLINKIEVDDYLKNLVIESFTVGKDQGLPLGHVL
jgi:retron-type reverse transcriptase